MTISLCMIVKNEERILARCLDSIADLMDEIIIVDTGSTDATKEIARKYTDKVYDFEWVNDFAAARNYAFSKASMDYIYSADADEVLNSENHQKFKALKEALMEEIEIVQMKYGNQLENGTVYNFDEEYRPKLFKRNRQFVWIEPIHETVRLDPVVYDSDIVITHLPENNHAGRDIGYFEREIKSGKNLSKRLLNMYIRELYLNGTRDNIEAAKDYLLGKVADFEDEDDINQIYSVLARGARMDNDAATLMKYVSRVVAGKGCSEICFELGEFYYSLEDYEEACMWYYTGLFDAEPIISIQSGGNAAMKALIDCYRKMGMEDIAREYEIKMANLDI